MRTLQEKKAATASGLIPVLIRRPGWECLVKRTLPGWVVFGFEASVGVLSSTEPNIRSLRVPVNHECAVL